MARKFLPLLCAAFIVTAPALAQAQGEIERGAGIFTQTCAKCHVVRTPEGQVLAGRAARTGPNLYGIVGRPAASLSDYRYGGGLRKYGETGGVWNEETFVPYVLDPTEFLRAQTGDSRARSRMAAKLRDAQEVRDVWVYLQSLN